MCYPTTLLHLFLLTFCREFFVYLIHLQNYKLPVEPSVHFLIFVNQVDLLRYNFLFLTVLFLVSKNEMVTSTFPPIQM